MEAGDGSVHSASAVPQSPMVLEFYGDLLMEAVSPPPERNKLPMIAGKASVHREGENIEDARWGLPANAPSAVLSATSVCCHLSG